MQPDGGGPPTGPERPFVTVYLLIVHHGRHGPEVLLQLRAGTDWFDDHWSCSAGGRLEAGESVAQCARREAAEEIGIEVPVSEPRLYALQHRDLSQSGTASRLDVFFSWLTTERPTATPGDKVAAVEWFAFSRLPAPLVPSEAGIIRAASELVDADPRNRRPSFHTR